MNDFERFSALVERALVNGWRNAVKADGTDGILIGHEDLGGEWEFTFSIRVDRSWHPAKRRCKPVDMSSPAWAVPKDGDEGTPTQKALAMALEMFDDIGREIDYATSLAKG
jgi:hypothetical protein